MESGEDLKLVFMKEIKKQTFTSGVNFNIDNNVGVQKVICVESFIFDERFECGNGKCLYSGKLGVKVMYVDTDGLSNCLCDSVGFSESFADDALTVDGVLFQNNLSLINSYASTESSIKVTTEISFAPKLYLNLKVNNDISSFENMIVKRDSLQTYAIQNVVNSSFDYALNLESKDNIDKVLHYNTYFAPSEVTAKDNFAVVEGKMFAEVIFESSADGTTEIKELHDSVPVKIDVEIEGLKADSVLDVNFYIDCDKTKISVDKEEKTIAIDNKIIMKGIALCQINMEVVDDLYSLENETEFSYSSRELISNVEHRTLQETVSNDVTLLDDEPAIEQLIANCDANIEITNKYEKDGMLMLEGVVSSEIVYLDENKNLQTKFFEMPFLINTKIEYDENCIYNVQIGLQESRIRSKRGTIVEIEYTFLICVECYSCRSANFVDNVTIGKAVDFGDVDYQIYIGKENETTWDICKRTRTNFEDLLKLNQNLPNVLKGGEKIIVKR